MSTFLSYAAVFVVAFVAQFAVCALVKNTIKEALLEVLIAIEKANYEVSMKPRTWNK